MIPIGTPARVYVVTITALIGLLNTAIGVWCLIDPRSFARVVAFPAHEHFVHDVGAFQVGLGIMLLLALIWSDAMATVLVGYIVANTVHTANHVVDLDLGGSALQAWALGAASVLLIVALLLRLRQLGYVLGNVSVATDPLFVPFVRQKTIRLTTFRKDGTAGTSPVSIAVDGERAYFRTYESAIKARRIRRNPNVEFGSATMSGKPIGPMLPAQARLLEGAEYRHAARLLRRKYPVLHGVVVPSIHRLMPSKYGHTVHAELIPSGS
ncbi:PPOX class F420-dependent enzyme [Mycobacterium sp. 1245111.1]|uniref:PPOX class F420-dependent oxidoreductase n=1 Tax=Mycobacterium sp. 1245111.1 TaxID=1834073 RepID=UPI0007FC04E6|nr:PPOX class F420-dependent oxidoreductase [Mycobacterium sp. 1245111.1]OBK33987.1 PPOX class F420-dependent enzyme [Mycobacterium sp. 1245111.1]